MPAPEVKDYTVIWSDDFNGSAGSKPDGSKWEVISKRPDPSEHTGEVQTYTTSTQNVKLSGSGLLHITPEKDASGNWTSGRLEGKQSFSCPDGHRLLLRAELRQGTAPASQQAGIWPAFWALGKDHKSGTAWPECGEWDIFENAGGANYTLASLHYGPHSTDPNNHPEISKGGEQQTFDVNQFHTFSLKVNRTPSDWRQESLEWYLDGKNFATVTGADVNDPVLWGNVAHKAFYPVLDVAVGSNFPTVGGPPNGNTVTGLGSGMQVKYVAFYKST